MRKRGVGRGDKKGENPRIGGGAGSGYNGVGAEGRGGFCGAILSSEDCMHLYIGKVKERKIIQHNNTDLLQILKNAISVLLHLRARMTRSERYA